MTDPELCLALARAMGHSRAEVHDDGEVWLLPDEESTSDHFATIGTCTNGNRILSQLWDPINSGADFDAMLWYAFVKPPRIDVLMVMANGLYTLPDDCPIETWRRAVCAAIVGAVNE